MAAWWGTAVATAHKRTNTHLLLDTHALGAPEFKALKIIIFVAETVGCRGVFGIGSKASRC